MLVAAFFDFGWLCHGYFQWAYPIFMIGVTQLLMIFNDSNYNFWITPIKKWLTNC